MDSASVFKSEGCGFESRWGRLFLSLNLIWFNCLSLSPMILIQITILAFPLSIIESISVITRPSHLLPTKFVVTIITHILSIMLPLRVRTPKYFHSRLLFFIRRCWTQFLNRKTGACRSCVLLKVGNQIIDYLKRLLLLINLNLKIELH